MIVQSINIQGHIIDSLILAKVLDAIVMLGGTFTLSEVTVGTRREDTSHATILIEAPTMELLQEILKTIQPHGAVIETEEDCTVEPSPADGILPEDFYATSHLSTQIRWQGNWIDVPQPEMDLAIRLKTSPLSGQMVPMGSVKKGDLVVTGRKGVRVFPLERPKERDAFGFMEAQVSSERPHHHIIADVAKRMKAIQQQRKEGKGSGKVLFAGGPAIIHAGGREALAWIIEAGYIHVLFCGNALAAHDMEASLYGTSLGYNLGIGRSVPHGHEHHLRTINRVRALGSIQQAIKSGLIKDGIMAACIRQGVQMVLAGTIRDDGPLPDVITDSIKAQEAMRAAIPGVGLALLVASTLHAVATGNLLPASSPTVCVDINPAVPTKLSDRGSFQAVGLVMDSSSFLWELARELGWKG
ncbi:MAG: TIGR00300 family protein [Nitrospirales bacterium]|nr:MAG: TIGR00300 family protein [Nitrospirales bacterium]